MIADEKQAIQRALGAEKPRLELRAVASEMLAAGVPKEALLDDFEQLRGALRENGRKHEEDVVLEVMDDLTGFSSTRMQL